MKRLSLLLSVASLFTVGWHFAAAQTTSFSMTAQEVRGISSDQLARPNIPNDAIANDPNPNPIPLPLYLTYRYYSCLPWRVAYVQSVWTSMSSNGPVAYQIDTQNDTDTLQLVNEDNEALLGFSPGTVANHPAYGLYCLKVTICVPYQLWNPSVYHQYFVRFSYNCPYICWWEHWWYYWRTPLYAYRVNLTSLEEVPPNGSPATGSGVIYLDPIYKTIGYDINYSGLGSAFSAAHIHGPSGVGTNSGVIFPLVNIPSSANSGRLYGQTAALTPTQISYLQNQLLYVNVHSQIFPGGEIRSQVRPQPLPVYCPWRPSWIPLLRWGRGGPLWCLTVTHPYGWGWDPWYRQRNFCLYGLRYYFPPIGPFLVPGGVVPPLLQPLPIGQLNYYTLNYPWQYYPYLPLNRYWPYSPYCARWYWWQCTPFIQYRWAPPTIQFATWVNPDPLDVTPAPVPFPVDPNPQYPGTVAVSTMRPLVTQPADQTGDGAVNVQDLAGHREQQGVDSFFDVFLGDF